MIKDKKAEYWVRLERSQDIEGVYYCPEDEEEYMAHWGKWLIYGKAQQLAELAKNLDAYVNKGEIDSGKYNRKPSPVGRGDCVMCVYCDDRDRERVWDILYSLGVTKKIWKYDKQTYQDWEPGGRLRDKVK